jgi:hypothetical protein
MKIEISKHAADCLAWFVDHPFYGDTISEVVIELTEEWGAREGKSLESMWVNNCYKELKKAQKQ